MTARTFSQRCGFPWPSAQEKGNFPVVVSYLTGQNALTVIATHDVELADRLNGECAFYHFTDSVDETGLKFDYVLKAGVATTRNAVALLRYLGYPREITEGAGNET